MLLGVLDVWPVLTERQFIIGLLLYSPCHFASQPSSAVAPAAQTIQLTQSATTVVTAVTVRARTAPQIRGSVSTSITWYWKGRALCGFGGAARIGRKQNVTDWVGVRRNNRIKRIHMRSAGVHKTAASERHCVKTVRNASSSNFGDVFYRGIQTLLKCLLSCRGQFVQSYGDRIAYLVW